MGFNSGFKGLITAYVGRSQIYLGTEGHIE